LRGSRRRGSGDHQRPQQAWEFWSQNHPRLQ
jgi:hypothetical protein